MQIKQIINKAFELGSVEIKDIGVFSRRDITHQKKVGNNVTPKQSTIVFKLDKKLRKYEKETKS